MSKESKATNSSEPSNMSGLVNASGFQFQLAVEHLVKSVGTWSVVVTEYAWTHPDSHTSGFVDAVLEDRYGVVRLVVECKRVREGRWVFLAPSMATRVDTLWTTVSQDQEASGIDGLMFNPESALSQFCAVRGSGEQQRPMLERIAANLVDATEAVSRDQFDIDSSNRTDTVGSYWMYVPIIVTNADLYSCAFDPADVNPASGEIPRDAVFTPIDVVRFAKALSAGSRPDRVKTLQQLGTARRRTVIVVNINAFPDFLRTFRLTGSMPEAMRRLFHGRS